MSNKTKEQYEQKWIEIGLSTAPLNKARIEELLPKVVAECVTKGYIKDPVTTPTYFASPKALVEHYGIKVNEISAFGQHDASWLAYYDYEINENGRAAEFAHIVPFLELSAECGWMYVEDGVCGICERPIRQTVDAELRAHNKEEKFVEYSDGFGVYCLDGVLVSPEEFAIMKGDDVNAVLAIENVDRRVVIMKYFGIEKMLKGLNTKILDVQPLGEVNRLNGQLYTGKTLTALKKQFKDYSALESPLFTDYVLLEVQLFGKDGAKDKLLRMKNPSEPKVHFEFVTPECETVRQALEFRYDDPKADVLVQV